MRYSTVEIMQQLNITITEYIKIVMKTIVGAEYDQSVQTEKFWLQHIKKCYLY